VTAIATALVSGEDTPFWDVIPGTAQLKSIFQLVAGDPSGAKKTQINYLNEGVGPAQFRSAYFVASGDTKKALDIQRKCFSNFEGLIDGLPVVGHVKGGIHLLAGDHDHGWDAIKSATSTTGTILGAVVLGPIGAVGGHLLTDTAITVTDYALNENKSHPYGLIEYFKNINNKAAGEHFDALAGLVVDGWTGSKVKTKTDSFNKPQTVEQRSNRMKELSKGLTFKTLMQDETKYSKLEDPHEWFDYEDPQEMREIPQGMPIEAEEKREGKPDEKSPKIPVKIPATLVESSDIGVASPSIRAESSDTHVESSDLLRNTEMNEELQTQSYKSFNLIRKNQFSHFVNRNPSYANFNFRKFEYNEPEKQSFLDVFDFKKPDVDALKNRLHYLTDDEKSLITKDDFQTVNKDGVETDSILSSLAGVMNKDVETLNKRLSKEPKRAYNPILDNPPKSYFKELKKRNNIDFYSSDTFVGLKKLNDFLRTDSSYLEGKKLILTEMAGGEEGNAVVMKIKRVKDSPDPVKLFIDYQTPGLVSKGLPNPYRFTTHVENPNSSFKIHVIGVVKSAFRD